MGALLRGLARLLPLRLAKRLGAAAWGERSSSTSGLLRGQDCCLWAHSGSRCWPGESVPASGDFLTPEFNLALPPAELLPPARETLLTVSLVQGNRRVPLGQQPVNLTGQTLHVRGPAVPLQDSRLFPHPGHYCLTACLGQQEVARLGFRLIGDGDLAQEVTVIRVSIDAERRDGRMVRGLRVLRWQEHLAVLPSFRIATTIPAPNSLMRCVAQTLQGTVVLASESFLLPLGRPAQTIKLRRLEFHRTAFGGRSKPIRFTLAVYIGGELKAATPFLLLPAEQIANAEGQLIEDAKDLPVDDLEYDQILNSLALSMPPPVRRRFWRS